MTAQLRDFICCEKCSHSTDEPCPKRINCLLEGPLCHEDEACTARRVSMLSAFKRDKLERPAIYIGAGTCGLGAGAAKTLAAVREYIKANEVDADVVEVGCIGLCVAEPLLDVQLPGRTRVSFQQVTGEKTASLLKAALAGDMAAAGAAAAVLGQIRSQAAQPFDNIPYLDEHPFFAPQKRWVLANCGLIDPNEIDEYIARGGYAAYASSLRERTPGELCDIVEDSGLRGRGGGGFPAGKKWKFALDAAAEQKYLICNADEGDPGAFMDRAVIEGDPHRLLEGMAIAAYAIGASKAYVYIRAEYPLAIRRLKNAIAQAQSYGLLGSNILDSGLSLDVVIKMGAGAFVCGEETALIHSIEGRRGMPRPRPPFPAVKGLFDRPTVINNVETLANVPAIIGNGAQWFNAVGTAGSKGTKVFALSGKVTRTGLVEVAMGTKLRQIVFDIGGGIANGNKYKAVQIGGPSGGCIPEQHLDIEIDYESLKQVGAMMGSGGLVVMDDKNCMVDVAKFFMDFIQRESCGKCIPCREGTRRMLEILKGITRSRRSEKDYDTLERFRGVIALNRLAEVIKDTSLCGLGQTAPNPVLSTLRWFREEYEEHIYERKCRAGACTELLRYRIDESVCKGCTICAKKCPATAIMGAPKSPHYIVQEKCIGCGQCVMVCPTGALREQNQIKQVLDALNDSDMFVVAQHAPAVSVTLGEEFGVKSGTDIAGVMTAALRQIGFDRIFDTAFTADLTIMEEGSELVERIKNGGTLPMMTSCSPGWIKFVEQFYPEYIPNLSTCKSPQQMMGAVVKSYFAQREGMDPAKIFSVSIMPCTAKKFEAERPEMVNGGIPDVDAVLTTRELAKIIRMQGLDLDALDADTADTPFGERSTAGKLFGASGGVTEAAIRSAHFLLTGEELSNLKIQAVRGLDGVKEAVVKIGDLELHAAVVSGLGNARKLLEDIKAGRREYHFIEVMTCPGGCIAGGGQPLSTDLEAVRKRMLALYNIDRDEEVRVSHKNADVLRLYDEFLGKPLGEKSHHLLHTHYSYRPVMK